MTVNALHPATFMPTKIVANPISTIEEGVDATMRLMLDERSPAITGKYFNGVHEARADAQAYDATARRNCARCPTSCSPRPARAEAAWPERAEERAEVVDQARRLLHRREVAAARHHGVARRL